MAIVAGILALVVGAAALVMRGSRGSVTQLGTAFGFHMNVRKAADKLADILVEGTEVIKPAPGGTLAYLAVKDVINNIRVFHLVQAANRPAGARSLVMQVDQHLPGVPASRTVLVENVRDARFTALGPGLVLVNLTMIPPGDPAKNVGKEVAALFEVPLVNLTTRDE